jgi:hypothetical protein
MVIPVDYDIKQVQKEVVWKNIIVEDAKWAYAKESSFKRALQESLDKEEHFRQKAKSLQKHILDKFSHDKIHKQFVDSVLGFDSSLIQPPEAGENDVPVLEFE